MSTDAVPDFHGHCMALGELHGWPLDGLGTLRLVPEGCRCDRERRLAIVEFMLAGRRYRVELGCWRARQPDVVAEAIGLAVWNGKLTPDLKDPYPLYHWRARF